MFVQEKASCPTSTLHAVDLDQTRTVLYPSRSRIYYSAHLSRVTDSLTDLCTKIKEDLASDHSTKAHLLKLIHAAEKAFADRNLLLDENRLLFT